jgi:hypothetical protein
MKKAILFLTALALSIGYSLPSPTPAPRMQATALEAASNTLAVGEWVQMSGTSGLSNFKITGNALNYTDNLKYDPTSRQAFFVGSDHGVQGEFLIYDEDSDAWSVATRPSFAPVGTTWHGWDMGAIDRENGNYYTRDNNTGRQVYKYDIAAATWSTLGTLPIAYGTSVTEAMEFFPGVDAAPYRFFSGGVYELQGSDYALIESIPSFGGTFFYADHNTIHDVILFWSNLGAQMYEMDNTKTVTTIANPPDMGGGDTFYDGTGHVGVITHDPVSGINIVLSPSDRQVYTYDLNTDTWAGPLSISTQPNFNAHGVAATPTVYGTILFVACPQGASACTQWLYKHADSFTTKCAQSGVIRCIDFDDQNDLLYNWDGGSSVCNTAMMALGESNHSFSNGRGATEGNTQAVEQNGECIIPTIDTSHKLSGAGSLKFTIPDLSGANMGGFFSDTFLGIANQSHMCIGTDASCVSDVVYWQFRNYFSQELLETIFYCGAGGPSDPGCNGFKQIIFYCAPHLGTSSSNCEITHNSIGQQNPSFAARLVGMYGQQGNDFYGYQDVRGCTYNYTGTFTYFEPPCVMYDHSRWQEFTVRLEVNGASNAAASHVQLWVDGSLTIDMTTAKVDWNLSQTAKGIGQFMITPYMTNKRSDQAHATGYMWFDDFIISLDPIAMGGGGGAGDTPDPPSPSVGGSTRMRRIR